MEKLTKNQIYFLSDHYTEELQEYINDTLDRDLIYNSDIYAKVTQFSNIVDVLQGKYTMDDLLEDLTQEYYEDEDLYLDFCNECLNDDELKKLKEAE